MEHTYNFFIQICVSSFIIGSVLITTFVISYKTSISNKNIIYKNMAIDKLTSVTAQEMRTQLSDLLNRAAYLKEATLVTRQGKAVAVLVSAEDWEDYLRLKKEGDTRAAGAAVQTADSGQEGVSS